MCLHVCVCVCLHVCVCVVYQLPVLLLDAMQHIWSLKLSASECKVLEEHLRGRRVVGRGTGHLARFKTLRGGTGRAEVLAGNWRLGHSNVWVLWKLSRVTLGFHWLRFMFAACSTIRHRQHSAVFQSAAQLDSWSHKTTRKPLICWPQARLCTL